MIVFSSHKKHLVTTRLHLKMEMKILQTIIVGILSFKTVVAGPQYGGGQQSQGTKIWIGFITILIAIKIRCNILLWFIVSLWGSFFEHFILCNKTVCIIFKAYYYCKDCQSSWHLIKCNNTNNASTCKIHPPDFNNLAAIIEYNSTNWLYTYRCNVTIIYTH